MTNAHRNVDLDENALAGTEFGRVDRVRDVSLGHQRQAARSARIVEHLTSLADIRDAIFELHEHVGAVVDTETVSGAEILVDPDVHR